MTQPWQGRAAFVPGCALLRHLCNRTTGENMNLFPNADALDVFRQDIDKMRAAMQEGANHLLHIHNLQHAIIQEIVNTNLYRSYETLGKAKVLEFEYDGASVKLFLPTGPIDLIQRDILWKRNFFHPESLEMIRALMPMSGERILDIGAYIGNHTVFFAKILRRSGSRIFRTCTLLVSGLGAERSNQQRKRQAAQFRLGRRGRRSAGESCRDQRGRQRAATFRREAASKWRRSTVSTWRRFAR